MIYIREASDSDLDEVLLVERSAFGRDDEAKLVKDLLFDPSAKPVLSLLAFREDSSVGHILFTTARINNQSDLAPREALRGQPERLALRDRISATILAPLAVVPNAQRQGIGGKLIKTGLQLLSRSGVDLVFVLGYPEYYSRYGFKPAGTFGLEASYPIREKHFDAWMVLFLNPELKNSVRGKVICADALNKPEYWIE